jgi:molybdopterin synthase catalytic subunit
MTILLTSEPLDPGVLLSAFLAGRSDTGGVVSFTGLVRADDGVEALELEAYEGFTEAEIQRFHAQAVRRFALDDAACVHRIGWIPVGDPVVFVAAAARHRRAAFEGADYLMDYLKSAAPFWKKSHERSGARWIEPSDRDLADRARWET